MNIHMNNTNKKYKIIKNNSINKKYIIGGVLVTTLFISCAKPNNIKKEYDLGQEQYNYYSTEYMNAINNMNESEFDNNFINIYKNGTYTINNQKYEINTIYISKLKDGSVHIYKAGENNYDIINSNEFYEKKKVVCCFRDSSVFFKLYEDGVFTNENIEIDNQILQDYINEWDSTKHTKLPELKADSEASKKYKLKYGR